MLKIVCSNIRFESEKDGIHNWPNRKKALTQLLLAQSPNIIGTQEGREPQLRELDQLLRELTLIDHHRDWIDERMYPCLWYDQRHFNLLSSQDFWLSETPNIAGSKSFDSAFPRLVTVAKLLSKESNFPFLIANCHLDHLKEETRLAQIEVLITSLSYYNQEGLPLILMGDFNSSAQGDVRNKLTSLIELRDPWVELNRKEETTFHHFKGENYDQSLGSRIDWILSSPNLKATSASILKDHDNGLYPSDHYPISAQFLLPPHHQV